MQAKWWWVPDICTDQLESRLGVVIWVNFRPLLCGSTLIGALCVQAAYAQYCVPGRVVDGDTFHFQRGAELVKVRVVGFDAPERGQAYGRVATAKLKELTQAGADCDCFKTDKYGRSVCRVRVGGRNVAVTMLQEGLGCIDPRFVGEDSQTDQQANAQALRSAQAARRGMWADDAPMCGKEYRDTKRAKR